MFRSICKHAEVAAGLAPASCTKVAASAVTSLSIAIPDSTGPYKAHLFVPAKMASQLFLLASWIPSHPSAWDGASPAMGDYISDICGGAAFGDGMGAYPNPAWPKLP